MLGEEKRAARSHHDLRATLRRYGLSIEGPPELLRARYEGLEVGRTHAALATTLLRMGSAMDCAGPPRSGRIVGSLAHGQVLVEMDSGESCIVDLAAIEHVLL